MMRKSIRRRDEEKAAITCEICLEAITLPNGEFKNDDRCSHPFCTDCITKYIEAKLEEHQRNIKCPDLNCYQFLDPISCRMVVGPSVVVKWCDVLCESAIAGVNKCYCPNRDCNAVILNECCGGSIVKKVQCPNCNKRFCFNCQRDWSPWHSWFNRRCEEDEAFNRLAVERNWRRCPRCRFFVEPLAFSGRIILCRCGNSFCYDCGINAPHRCIDPVLIDLILFELFDEFIFYALLAFAMFVALLDGFLFLHHQGYLCSKKTRMTIRRRQDQGPRETRNGDTEQEEKAAVTCEICLEQINRKFKNKDRCNHLFCTDCITNYIKAKVDHHQGNIKCPDLNCYQFLDPISCGTVIGPSLAVKWCDVLCKSAITGVDKCYCPNRDCNALILNECGGGIVKKAQCPDCNKRFCFTCQRDWSPWHPWSRCEREDADDEDFNNLVTGWKRCPRCRFFVEPICGRRIILCRCGTSFCYACGIHTSEDAVAHTCIEPEPEAYRWIRIQNYISFAVIVFAILPVALWDIFWSIKG